MKTIKYGIVAACALVCAVVIADVRVAAQEASTNETKVAGCLQAGEAAGTFTLMTEDKQTYQVTADASAELSKHVGQRVEIVGVSADSSGEASASPRRLAAKSVRMIAASCS